MADKNVSFFNPADTLGISSGGWIQQENNLTDSQERAQGLAANGDEAANKLYDGKTSGTLVYENHSESGNLTLPKVGDIKGGYHIDDIKLEYQEAGWPKLTVTVHQHDSNPHDATTNPCNTFTSDVTFPAQFGIPRQLTFATTDLFANLSTDCGVSSLSFGLACTHEDVSESGEHLAGENRDGVETLDISFTGDPGGTFAIASGWSLLSDGDAKTNTGALGVTMNWERHIARD